jgi:hypothetical protein
MSDLGIKDKPFSCQSNCGLRHAASTLNCGRDRRIPRNVPHVPITFMRKIHDSCEKHEFASLVHAS